MKTVWILIVISVLAVLHACDAGKKPGTFAEPDLIFASPEEAGLLPDSLHRIDTLIQRYVDNHWIPGAVALIARDGKIAYEVSLGSRDVASGEPLATDHIFRLASMTKPVIAVAVMQLAEQGKLGLTDPLSGYIPEFLHPGVLTFFNPADTTWEERPASREITIRDLMTHSSGIGYGFMDPRMAAIYGKYQIPDMATPLDLSLEEKMGRLGCLPLLHDPGERHTYGLSSDVLGRVIEVASGMPLDAYITRYITAPLGMTSTFFFLPENLHDQLVEAYVAQPDSTIIPIGDLGGTMYHPDYPVSGAQRYCSGGSGLSGSARDYYLFLQAMLDGGTGGNPAVSCKRAR